MDFYCLLFFHILWINNLNLTLISWFSLFQVERSCSFLNQLIVIQQKQHTAADHFAKHLNHLRSCVSLLEKLYSSSKDSSARNGYESRISCNQEIIYRCMWQQKVSLIFIVWCQCYFILLSEVFDILSWFLQKIFDSLNTMAQEELILLKSFKNVHLKSCRSIKSEEHWIIEAIETYLPGFQKSKVQNLIHNFVLFGCSDVLYFCNSCSILLALPLHLLSSLCRGALIFWLFGLFRLPIRFFYQIKIIQSILQECLDNYLLGQKEVISTPASILQPYVVTEQMKELVSQNFEVINIFKEHLSTLSKRVANQRSIENILLGHFDEVFEKVCPNNFHPHHSCGLMPNACKWTQLFVKVGFIPI